MKKSLLYLLLFKSALIGQPLELGSRLEIMVDHSLIDVMTGVSLELQTPSHAGHELDFNDSWDRDKFYMLYFRVFSGWTNYASASS